MEDGVYTTYLFGQGAIAYGIGNPEGHVATETDRDRKKGSGVNYLINRRCFIMHPRGIAWQIKFVLMLNLYQEKNLLMLRTGNVYMTLNRSKSWHLNIN